MRIADSTVNMLSGRNYTQTGMQAGGRFSSSFMGMVNSYSTKKAPWEKTPTRQVMKMPGVGHITWMM